MLGLIISVGLAALLVVTSAAAMRRGVLEVGDRRIARHQALFWVLTVGGMIGGTAIMMVGIRAYMHVRADDEAPPRVFRRDGVQVVIPAGWNPLPELEEMMGSASTAVLAVGGEGAELLVLWPSAGPAAEAKAIRAELRATAAGLENPAIAYQRWVVTDVAQGVVVDAEYASPRGLVIARHILFEQAGALRVVSGTCSTEGDVATCRTVIGSMTQLAVAPAVASGAAPVEAVDPLREVACGRAHACALDGTGTVSCWAADTVPQRVLQLSGIEQIVAAGDRTCLRVDGGAVNCLSGDGQRQVTRVSALRGVTRLAMGPTNLCGIDAEKRVRCWGDAAGVAPDDIRAAYVVAVGDRHACALTERGEIFCWGANDARQLGPKAEGRNSRFVLRGALTLVAAGDFTCALLATKQPWCWGTGFGEATAIAEPVVIEGVDDVLAMAAGGSGVCARLRSGAVTCWGDKTWLGGAARYAVPAITGATRLSVGGAQACAISTRSGGSSLACWRPGQREAPTTILLPVKR